MSKLAWLAAGAGLAFGFVWWRSRPQRQQPNALRQHAPGSGFGGHEPWHGARPQPMRQLPQLQQPRPQFHAPPPPQPRVQNMLPQNPQVAPFSVPTPPPMQYPAPPPPPIMQGGSDVGSDNDGSGGSGYAVELEGF